MTSPADTRPEPRPRPAGATAGPAARPVAPPRHRPRGGSPWSGILTAGFAGLFVSGLFLWLWPGSGVIILAHSVGGLVTTVAILPWLARHVPRALCHAQRPGFTLGSWALLATWVLLLGSGVAMVVPMLAWVLGLVWFPARELTEAMSLVHFWASWAAMAGLLLHLALRHWRLPAGAAAAVSAVPTRPARSSTHEARPAGAACPARGAGR